MSQLKVNTIRHTGASSDAITLAADGTAAIGECTAKITNNLSNRNKVINGDMRISQRGASFTDQGEAYTLDRWLHTYGTSATLFDSTTTQSTESPDGFGYSLKVVPDSTQTPSGGQNAVFEHRIEGQDLQDLAFGTSSAKQMTLSFWAKSSAQNNGHQYSLQYFKYDTAGNGKILTKAFTVTSSWQKFTWTVSGDTATDIRNTNASGIRILWHFASGPDDIQSEVSTWTASGLFTAVTGQDNFLDHTSNEFYLTGVQLEVGDTATNFEHMNYGYEFMRCERYYQVFGDHGGNTSFLMPMAVHSSTAGMCAPQFRTTMRAAPTLTATSVIGLTNGNGSAGNPDVAIDYARPNSLRLKLTNMINLVQGDASILQGGYVTLSAEL